MLSQSRSNRPKVQLYLATINMISLRLSSLILIFLLVNQTVVQTKIIVPFRKNIDQVLKQWNCNKPQSRLVYLGNYISIIYFKQPGFQCTSRLENAYEDYNPAAIYLPHAVVVQQCDNSIGCCKPGQNCAPADVEDMTFIVEEFYRGRKVKKEIVISNHLRCECQGVNVDKK